MSIYKGSCLTIEITGAPHSDELCVNMLGFPCGEAVDLDRLLSFLKRRAPGQNALTTCRREKDEPVFLTGISDGITDGAPIKAVIKNTDVRREDYVNLSRIPRPGHADFTAWKKYGLDFDMSGGGPFSGRMTAPLCIAGGICLQYLSRRGIEVSSRILSIGGKEDCFEETVAEAFAQSDSVGGVIECEVIGCPAGLGGEIFDGLEGKISELVFSVPAVKGIEFGAGFKSVELRGSENNDEFTVENGEIKTSSNNHGGILGGISSGMPIVFRAAFKPTPSIGLKQKSVDLTTGEPCEIEIHGRHDPCIVLRAAPVIESCAAIALSDLIIASERADDLYSLRRKIDCIDRDIKELFVKRMDTVLEIAKFKAANGIPTLDSAREASKLNELAEACPYPDEASELYKKLFELSRRLQDGVL